MIKNGVLVQTHCKCKYPFFVGDLPENVQQNGEKQFSQKIAGSCTEKDREKTNTEPFFAVQLPSIFWKNSYSPFCYTSGFAVYSSVQMPLVGSHSVVSQQV